MGGARLIYPTNPRNTWGPITGHYGPRESFWTPGGWTAGFHYGIDIGSSKGLELWAVISGTAYLYYDNPDRDGWGNRIDLYGDDGVIYRYAHLEEFLVNPGRVTQGQEIGVMGTTGRSTGTHLHFEVVKDGKQINPYTYYNNQTPEEEFDTMASREEIKQVVAEVVSARPDAVLIHSNHPDRNGIFLAAPGVWHQFTSEQWTQFTAHGLRQSIRDVKPVNSRDFDVFKEIYSPDAPAPATLSDAQFKALLDAVTKAVSNAGGTVDDATIKKIADAAIDTLAARVKD